MALLVGAQRMRRYGSGFRRADTEKPEVIRALTAAPRRVARPSGAMMFGQ